MKSLWYFIYICVWYIFKQLVEEIQNFDRDKEITFQSVSKYAKKNLKHEIPVDLFRKSSFFFPLHTFGQL